MDESADLEQICACTRREGVVVVTSGEKGRSREEGGEETERRAEGRTGVGEDPLTHQPHSILIGGPG